MGRALKEEGRVRLGGVSVARRAQCRRVSWRCRALLRVCAWLQHGVVFDGTCPAWGSASEARGLFWGCGPGPRSRECGMAPPVMRPPLRALQRGRWRNATNVGRLRAALARSTHPSANVVRFGRRLAKVGPDSSAPPQTHSQVLVWSLCQLAYFGLRPDGGPSGGFFRDSIGPAKEIAAIPCVALV